MRGNLANVGISRQGDSPEQGSEALDTPKSSPKRELVFIYPLNVGIRYGIVVSVLFVLFLFRCNPFMLLSLLFRQMDRCSAVCGSR